MERRFSVDQRRTLVQGQNRLSVTAAALFGHFECVLEAADQRDRQLDDVRNVRKDRVQFFRLRQIQLLNL